MLIKLFAFSYRNWIFARRNFFTFMEILFWPIMGLVSVGLMSSFIKLEGNLLNFILTGAITAGVLQVTQLDVSYGILYDIWSKSLKHTFLSPVSHYHYIFGSWIIGMVRGSVVFTILTMFSHFAFGFNLPGVLTTIIFVSGIYLYALSIGMTVCLLVLLFGERVDITAWSLASMTMLICGIYYPVTYLPKFFMYLSNFIPLTFFLEYFRSDYGFKPVFSHSLIKGYLLAFAYITLLFCLLRYATKKSQKTGMILRLSE